MFKDCYCFSLPTSVVMIVPENNTAILNQGKSDVLITYGVNNTDSAKGTYGCPSSTFRNIHTLIYL